MLNNLLRIFILCFSFASVVFGSSPEPRHLTLTYTCTIKDIPRKAGKLEFWIPVPASDNHQTVEMFPVELSGGRITREAAFGNQMYYRSFNLKRHKSGDSITVTFTYKITLWDQMVPEAKQMLPLTNMATSPALLAYLSDNRLIPLQGPVAQLGQEMALPAEPIRAARQIYDNLIDRMVYNSKAPGAKRGDANWACDSKTGNCSDYHSVFIGICRTEGIPADHVFGLPLRPGQSAQPIRDWHCWARFWVDGPGWITVDASEADKNPELRDYYFGTLSNVFLTISHGRDVLLEPTQKGPALNMFIEPYAEIDGKPFTRLTWAASFREE
jgi:transglutaminase-like putative cysteine protease